MGIIDRRTGLNEPITYRVQEIFDVPFDAPYTLVLLTDGVARLSLRGTPVSLHAPVLLTISADDDVHLLGTDAFSAQSFGFDPSFLRGRSAYLQTEGESPQLDVADILTPFARREAGYEGILPLPAPAFHRLLEWFLVIGAEMQAQSDARWTCRVRRCLHQMLELVTWAAARREPAQEESDADRAVDQVAEWIHIHYGDPIQLDDLALMAHTNRTTLNRNFKRRTGHTVIDYLLHYRLRVARELLVHTSLSIAEIAQATGFGDDTYLIRQFTRRIGKTPTAYRRQAKHEFGIHE